MKQTKETNKWNAKNYAKHANFVSTLGLPVVDLLNPKAEENILDLGCGDGTLAMEIAKSGAKITAVDLSADMVAKAKENAIEAYVMSATNLKFEKPFDAIFSNAVLHWVKESDLAIENIYNSLKDSGRFVAEFGGFGNVHHVVTAMKDVYELHPEWGEFNNPWYFPTAEEYQQALEKKGFKVVYIELIERATPIDDIANWLAIFSNGITQDLEKSKVKIFRDEVREILKDKIYTPKEGWVADYVRLRVEGMKPK